MRLFDSHCHLDDKRYQTDLAKVLERARRAGIEGFMVVGINLPTAQKAIRIAEDHPDVYAALGIHPHDAQKCSEAVLEDLIDLAGHDKVCAWGEIGLDFNRMYSPRKVQEKWFRRQLDIAADLDLPLIFHERDSGGRFLDILQSYPTDTWRGVVHCFSGDRRELAAYLELGLHIGITGIITMQARGRALRDLVPLIPEDRLLIETDAPYLTPAPERNRARRNEPAFVKSVLLKVAEVRQSDPAAMAESTWRNTRRLFKLTG
jgi:TatD DNase family protein